MSSAPYRSNDKHALVDAHITDIDPSNYNFSRLRFRWKKGDAAMDTDLWVFGYGSLMWDPGFTPVETVKARLSGYSRSFCLLSVTYRGTEEAPGLVLGLDEDPHAECRGLALKVARNEQEQVMAYLRGREMVTGAYQEMTVPLDLEDGRNIHAIAYVMQRDHRQYAGGLCTNEQADIIARAQGGRGPNAEYLFNTVRHLAEFDMHDEMLEQLSENVRRLMTSQGQSQA